MTVAVRNVELVTTKLPGILVGSVWPLQRDGPGCVDRVGSAKDKDRCAFPVVLSRYGQALDGVANGIGERGHGEDEVLTHPVSFQCQPHRPRAGA